MHDLPSNIVRAGSPDTETGLGDAELEVWLELLAFDRVAF